MKFNLPTLTYLRVVLLAVALFSLVKSNAQCGYCPENVVLDFDGVDDEVVVQGLTTTAAFTLAAWFNHSKQNTLGEEDRIMGFSTPRLEIGLQHGSGKLWFYNGNGGAPKTWGGDLHDELWHHVALTKKGSSMTIYLDGQYVDSWSTNANDIFGTPAGGFRVGNWWTSHSNSKWQGQMDDVTILEEALNPTQIKDLMNCKYNSFSGAMRVHYDWQNGTPNGNNAANTIAGDVSGNGIDGTLFGFALTGSNSNYTCPEQEKVSGPGCGDCGSNTVLHFDGFDDQVHVSGITTTPNFTIGIWFNHELTNTIGEEDRMIGFSTPRLEIGLQDGSGKLWAYEQHSTARSWGGDLHDDTWHHVALTKNGGMMTIYLDGSYVDSWNVGVNDIYGSASGGFRVGNWWTSHNNSRWHGELDDVVILDQALDSTQVQEMMSCDHTGLSGMMRIHYDWENGIPNTNNSTQTTAVDVSGNGIDGDLLNFTLDGNTSNYSCTDGMVSVDKDFYPENLIVYPNPITNALFIDAGTESYIGSIYTITGKLISRFDVSSGINKADVSQLAPGLYVLILKSDENFISTRLIKQ